MAVSEQTPYIEYTANGTATSFALEFDCEKKDHLIVLVDDVEPVVGVWSLSNGAVVFNTAPENGKKITLQRNTPFSRPTDYQSYNNSFRPPAVNKDFDWIWLKLQELGVADWILSNRISALKAYVDDQDDELRAYLMEEIRKQGVALDQLDEYYNYLMERLAQIAVNGGWEASFVVDATGQNQQKINDGIASIDELRLIDPKKKARRIYLNSVIVDKNLGGGTFVSTNKGGLVDNGGTIVDSANPNLKWVRVEYDVMTPEMFGCIGDGVTDDTVAMIKFGLAKHNNKVASNDYLLTATPTFNIEHESTIIDFSKSKIVGTNFAYTALEVIVNRTVKSLNIKTGSYNGGGVVNGYLEVLSTEPAGYADIINIECFGNLENFANEKNTRSTFGIRCSVPARIAKVLNPVVSNVFNKNGTPSISSVSGVALSDFQMLGVVENPVITGVYTASGVDADGLVLFEQKDAATTGTGLAIVKNATLNQCCGRGIKSQSNVVVLGADITLSAPSVGVVNTVWRGIDAQLGGMYCRGINFNLQGASLFGASSEPSLFQSSGSTLNPKDQIVKDVTLKGVSNIQYLMMLTSNNHKNIVIDSVRLLDAQSRLNCLYVTAGISVVGKISINNLSSGWWSSGRLFFDALYTGSNIPEISISNSAWDGYNTLIVSKFNKIRIVDTPALTIQGTLSYDAISKDSSFHYSVDGSAGITYTLATIPEWAKRYCHYEKGVVYSTFRNNVLTKFGTKFYQSLNTAPTEIV